MKLENSTLLIVGLGLIGGSVARAARAAGLCRRILACGRDRAPMQQALEDGVIDEFSTDLPALARQADLILVAVPTLTVAAVLAEMAGELRPGAVITDAASVKGRVVEDALHSLPDGARRFVPGHPIAGSEQSGYPASRADLFVGRKVILTPGDDTDPDAVQLVTRLWHAIGADVHGMSVARHDAVLAATSHLPHLLAYSLVNALMRVDESGEHRQDHEQRQQILDYAAGGFAGFSRIASSDPHMWRDIFLSNGPATIEVLDQFMDELQQMRSLLEQGDGVAMESAFRRAKLTRDRFMDRFSAATSAIRLPAVSSGSRVDFLAEAGGPLTGEIRVPGDKSISHRAIMLAAIAEGVTEISGFLEGEDALHTLQALRDLGVAICGPECGRVRVYGVGMHGLQAPRGPLYLGNSGTAMRLLAGLLSAQDFAVELCGDESLARRPMDRVAQPLRAMGADISTAADGRPPLSIRGGHLQGIEHEMEVPSAQVKSALLLAGLYAAGETRVHADLPSRDHTERMLEAFAVRVGRSEDGRDVRLAGGQKLQATRIDVPADISSAAFFLVAASIVPGSNLLLRHVGINPTRTGIITLLQEMGADLEILNTRRVGGEPVADIRVRHAVLRGIEVPEALVPLAIDEFPVFFVAAACAEGETVLRNAAELRVKESDRIGVMAEGLKALGVDAESLADGMRIRGGSIGGGEIDSAGDHRVAMAFAVAALRASGPLRIRDCANVATSFPGFLELANAAGLRLRAQQEQIA